MKMSNIYKIKIKITRKFGGLFIEYDSLNIYNMIHHKQRGAVMGKRQIAAQRTRMNLIIAAERLIAEHGFDGVTIQDITREAGVSVGAFYVYFKRKEDIVGEIAHSNFSRIERESMANGADAAEALRSFLTESMKYIVETGLRIAQQWFRDSVSPAEREGVQKLAYDLGVVRTILEQAVKKGELNESTPVEELRQWIVAEYYGLGTLWCMTDGDIDPVKLLDSWCRVQLKAFLSSYSAGTDNGQKSADFSRKPI